MFEITFNNTDKALIAALQNKGGKLFEALKTRVTYLSIMLQKKIVIEKLSGQVLQHKTGKLAQSVRIIPTTIEGNVIVGGVVAAGGEAWYGAVHEFGETGTGRWIVPVNKKALHFMIGGKAVFASKVFHNPLPQRSFVGSATKEFEPTVLSELNDALVDLAQQE